MGISCFWCGVLLYLALFLTPFPLVKAQQSGGYLTVKSSTSWTNPLSAPDSVKLEDGSFARIILASEGYGCGCGFFCNQTCDSTYLFAIFTLSDYDGNISTYDGPIQVVWSANPNNPVSVNSTLQLTSESGLVLQDANGTTAWSTNITNKSVAALSLTDMCNLMLLDEKNATIWQSFDHPTDTLVLGQKLVAGQNLTSEGELFKFSLSLTSQVGDPSNTILRQIPFPQTVSSSQYMRFGPDGHLRVYDTKWNVVYDIFTSEIDICGYPTFCGNYGICTNGQCSCHGRRNGTSYFQQINERLPDRGCYLVPPLSCEASQNHLLLEFENITYFPFRTDSPDINPDLQGINLESCKQACLNNCSCKATIYTSRNGVGSCYLQSQVFSLMSIDEKKDTHFKLYIKVQNDPPRRQKHQLGKILGSSLASFFVLFLLIGIFVFLFWKKENADECEEHYLDHVPGMPTRYSHGDLQAITENFNKVLGGGGFGTVFEGTLIDGTKVAVKRLDGLSQIKKSFLAEVETIGSIHHFNLVRLIGFCAEKSHRLLIYEYMCNGSLDRWVFHENLLDWQQRKKIILDIARGLTYLHEDCRQKIVHLDIKPQNILLDENFNAKVSDFGLSKLIDRNQSEVVTTMRGTPGYMAPEWSSSVITEKVDVYSFGVMLLEILCGKRNFDRSQQ